MSVTPFGLTLLLFLCSLATGGCRSAATESIVLIPVFATDQTTVSIDTDGVAADQGDWDDSKGKRTGTAEGAAVIGQGDATAPISSGALGTGLPSGGDSAEAGSSAVVPDG